MQTIHDPSILKTHFEILIRNREAYFNSSPYNFIKGTHGKFNLYFILSTASIDRDHVMNAVSGLEVDSHELTSCFLQMDRVSALGFILRNEKIEISQQFESRLKDSLLLKT